MSLAREYCFQRSLSVPDLSASLAPPATKQSPQCEKARRRKQVVDFLQNPWQKAEVDLFRGRKLRMSNPTPVSTAMRIGKTDFAGWDDSWQSEQMMLRKASKESTSTASTCSTMDTERGGLEEEQKDVDQIDLNQASKITWSSLSSNDDTATVASDSDLTDRATDGLNPVEKMVRRLTNPDPEVQAIAIRHAIQKAELSTKFSLIGELKEIATKGSVEALQAMKQWQCEEFDVSVRIKAQNALAHVKSRSRQLRRSRSQLRMP